MVDNDPTPKLVFSIFLGVCLFISVLGCCLRICVVMNRRNRPAMLPGQQPGMGFGVPGQYPMSPMGPMPPTESIQGSSVQQQESGFTSVEMTSASTLQSEATSEPSSQAPMAAYGWGASK